MDKLEVEGALGAKLAARIDRPSSETRAVALFAHCFTCGKDIFAARTIARRLAERGIATVRFDFTGLGSSEGEFASTYFSSNVGDLVKMADAMRDGIGAPTLLVGHSLGGAAVLAAAGRIPEVRAVATIGAPADVAHVAEQFSADLARIEAEGAAEVSLAGRTFTIRREFVDDLRAQALEADVASLRAALLVMHAPRDEVVGIDNATRIFLAAKHPKSFVSLDDADHLLSARRHADYAADVIAAWASRYVAAGAPADQEGAPAVLPSEHDGVRATDAGGRFRTDLAVGNHRLRADEPEDVGGDASGPTPYDLVAAGLAACTVMTMRLYAEGKGWTVEATVDVAHGKVHARDCEDCADAAPGSDGRIDRFERRIRFAPGTSPAERDKLLEIADKCPVHRSLERGAAVVTRTVD
ncbi:alpha/beta fold hydrolase [Acuticoccus sp.]|uniref:bifunctional alpha/beta hydrolase/OsmC family protein n=1 Tax=Acuticoccus sp. TaxID=1904378 RepID=UPI003B522643